MNKRDAIKASYDVKCCNYNLILYLLGYSVLLVIFTVIVAVTFREFSESVFVNWFIRALIYMILPCFILCIVQIVMRIELLKNSDSYYFFKTVLKDPQPHWLWGKFYFVVEFTNRRGFTDRAKTILFTRRYRYTNYNNWINKEIWVAYDELRDKIIVIGDSVQEISDE